MPADRSGDRPLRLAALLGAAGLVLVAVLYIPSVDAAVNPLVRVAVYYAVLLSFAFLAVEQGMRLWPSFGRGEVLRAIWLSLTLGLLLWALAEGVAAYYEVILRQDIPYPSLADALWLLAYIPLSVGLYLRFRSLRVALEARQWAYVLLPFLVILVPGLILVIMPLLLDVSYGTLVERLIGAAYPVGDLMLLLGVLLSALALAGGELGRMWRLVGGGFLVVAVSDLLFTYASWNGLYSYDSPLNWLTAVIDLTYLASYILLGIGVLGHGQLHRA
ncbi:MAG: hypothetical protein Kow00124_14490 [Anaerolineae bacterium]